MRKVIAEELQTVSINTNVEQTADTQSAENENYVLEFLDNL